MKPVRPRSRTLLLVLFFAALPAAAYAAAKTLQLGEAKTLQLSGVGGNAAKELRLGDGWVVHKITMRESGDRPDEIELVGWKYENGKLVTGDAERASAGLARFRIECPGCTSAAMNTDGNPKTLEVAANRERAFHGLEVCLNTSERRLKGLKAYASEFTEAGDPKKNPDLMKDFVRTNCDPKQWRTDRKCGEGQVLVGVKIEYTPKADFGISGLAPICAPAKIRSL